MNIPACITYANFAQQITVCFDPVYETTLSAHATVRGAHIAAKDTDGSRPSFKVDTGFFSVSANTCYEQDSQIQLMDELLGNSVS